MQSSHPNVIGNAEDQPPKQEDNGLRSITLREISLAAQTPKQLYAVAERAKFYLPAYQSSVVNGKFLIEVLRGECYLFRLQDLQFKPLLVPAKTKELQ